MSLGTKIETGIVAKVKTVARLAALTAVANATRYGEDELRKKLSKYIHITPVTSYNFYVFVDGFPIDTMFSEVGGIASELQVEEYTAGGMNGNGFLHHLPVAHKHGRLTLKRGISPMGSALMDWCIGTTNFDKGYVETRMVTVMLMTQIPEPLVAPVIPLHSWDFYDAYPVKWQISEFNAEKSAYALESLEFVYSRMSVTSTAPGII